MKKAVKKLVIGCNSWAEFSKNWPQVIYCHQARILFGVTKSISEASWRLNWRAAKVEANLILYKSFSFWFDLLPKNGKWIWSWAFISTENPSTNLWLLTWQLKSSKKEENSFCTQSAFFRFLLFQMHSIYKIWIWQ